MEGNDISNEVVGGRTLIHVRTFTIPRIEMDWGLVNHNWTRTEEIDLTRLAAVVRACSVLPRPMMITTDGDAEYAEALYDRIDDGYEHPFRGWNCYPSDKDLAAMLAWMPNTRVLDIEANAGVWGSRFLGMPW